MIRTGHLKSFKPRLLALFEGDTARSFNLRDIRDALGLKRRETVPLKAYLAELTAHGTLRTRGRRYWLPEPTAKKSKGAGGRGASNSGASNPGASNRRAPNQSSQAPPTEEGVYVGNSRGFGFVELDTPRRSAFVPPNRGGGALDGDRVRVKLFRDPRTGRGAAEVTEVVARRRTAARGYLEVGRRELWVTPLNDRLPLIFAGNAPSSQGLRDGTLVEVAITQYPQNDDEAPIGQVIRALPDDESPERLVEHILADHEVSPHHSETAIAEAAKAAKRAVTATGREDLLDLPFVTIDGEDARDFDDAVCLLAVPGGGWRLLVSIADVAHYVRPGSELDREAQAKGTSVYLPHRALPMLPEALSTDACSLKPDTRRLTLTCDMTLTPAGDITGYRIHESLIRSRARLTYSQVQALFDSGEEIGMPGPETTEMLLAMRSLADVLGQRRRKRGALALALPEPRYEIGPEGRPTGVHRSFPSEATRLIEQFMIEANEQVARHAAQHGLPILYRVHDPPAPDRQESLPVLLHNAGIAVRQSELSTPAGINAVLLRVQEHPQRAQLELAILKSMSQARYSPHNDGHFGLASECYTHFTSPIRRYPDLLLHRALKASWAGGEKGKPQRAGPKPLPSGAGSHLSDRERIAAAASQQVGKLFKVLVMQPSLGDTFRGTVTGVAERGIWVELEEPFVDGFLPLESLPFDRYQVDKERQSLRGLKSNREIRLGDRLAVQSARADPLTRTLEFGFLHWGWEQRPPPAKQPARRTAKHRKGKK